MEFTRAQLKDIRIDMQNSLSTLVDSGLTFKVGNCSFNSDTATFKVVVTLPNAVAPEVTALMDEIEREKMLGVIFSTSDSIHSQYQLVGYNNRARKRPYIFINKKTKVKYVCDYKSAKRMFAKDEPEYYRTSSTPREVAYLTLEGQEYQKYLSLAKQIKGSGGIPKSFDQWLKDREVA